MYTILKGSSTNLHQQMADFCRLFDAVQQHAIQWRAAGMYQNPMKTYRKSPKIFASGKGSYDMIRCELN